MKKIMTHWYNFQNFEKKCEIFLHWYFSNDRVVVVGFGIYIEKIFNVYIGKDYFVNNFFIRKNVLLFEVFVTQIISNFVKEILQT